MKCLLVAVVFLLGVLLGIQQANEGIKEMKGIDQLQHVRQTEQVEPAGASVSEKRKALEDIQTFNVFSAVGDLISEGITKLFRSGIEAVSAVIEQFLSS